MLNKITLTENQIMDFLEEDLTEHIDTDNSYRHGTFETYVVPYEGKFYEFTVSCHHSEGLEIWGDVEAIEVKQVEKIVKQWIPV